MPHAKCPNCGIVFHLLVQKNVDEWDKKFPALEDGHRYIECFACWKKLDESDTNERETIRGECKQDET